MTWLDQPGAFERQINRSPLHFRSARLNAIVAAMSAAERDPSDENLYNVGPALFQWRRSDPNEFNMRFGEIRYQQLMSEVLEARRAHQFGIPLVIDPASHPGYEPGLWNDGGMVQTSTNCYAYACNDRTGHRPAMFELDEDDELRPTAIFTPQPGHLAARHGTPITSTPTGTPARRRRIALQQEMAQARGIPGLTGPEVRYQVMLDDQERRAKLAPFLIAPNQDPINVPGYYLIALVVCGQDYHWLRQDDNSYWSHKPGISQVKDVDDDDELIWDPRRAAYRNIPYRFECFYQVPAGGVKTWSLGDM